MADTTRIILSEIHDIRKIVDHECWLEGERCGHRVDPHDPVIQRRVADLIMQGVGAFLRQKHTKA